MSRAQHKQENRRAMTDAATELFASEGYAGTTMEAVAQASGMSVQGVYFAFQTKANLLQAAVEAAGPVRPERSDEPDPDLLLRRLVDDAAAGLHATGALALAVAAAPPADRAVADLHRRLQDLRSGEARAIVQRARARRPLATGVTAKRVSDVVFALLSPQMHALLVRDRGWSTRRYAAWTADAIGRALWG
jgi:AcrR family transcriptional regulator